MTPSAEDDFLEFCKGIGAKTQQLEYQHQDSPEAWVHFNKIAFGTPFKRLPSTRDAQLATTVINVEGRYDENHCTNEAEARQVIDWLRLIEPTAAKNYPVVGIACATIQQRDLIAAQLLKIRQRKQPVMKKYNSAAPQQHGGVPVRRIAGATRRHPPALTYPRHDGRAWQPYATPTFLEQPGRVQPIARGADPRHPESVYRPLHTARAAQCAGRRQNRHLGTCVLSHLVTYADACLNAATPLPPKNNLTVHGRPAPVPREQHYPFTTFMEEVEIALRPYFDTLQIRRNAYAAGMHAPLFLIAGATKTSLTMCCFLMGCSPRPTSPPTNGRGQARQYFQKEGAWRSAHLFGPLVAQPQTGGQKIGGKAA